MNTITKIKIKLFIIKLVFELAIHSSILVFAILSGKILETLLFYICWMAFRRVVPKIFHVKTNNAWLNIIGCFICSFAVFVISVSHLPTVRISILASIVMGIFINYILYRIQDYVDLLNDKGKKTINIYSMTECELRNYAKSMHIAEQMIDTLVLRVVHNYKWIEIQSQLNFTKDGIRYHKEQLNKKLGVKL